VIHEAALVDDQVIFVVPLENTAFGEAETLTIGRGIAAFMTVIVTIDPVLTRTPSETVNMKLSPQTYPSAGV
jgi:hypothetical protein